jgi:F0F1-type ATP synthase membrane subunit c/vacuolar-type H+-ATPase subunit K
MRRKRGFGLALAETFGILGVAVGVVLICSLFLPGGAA